MQDSVLQHYKKEKLVYSIFFGTLGLLFIASTYYTSFNPFELLQKSENFWLFISEDFFPPAIPEGTRLDSIITGFITTLALAIAASSVGALFAFFVALFGSEFISPFPSTAKFVRGFATFLRNIPALVWAFILFSSLGIGTGVGFIALFITSFAFLVRAFIETMEDVSKDLMESLQSTGASFWQRVAQGVVPSCLCNFISWFLYCLEVNIRASTIVGMVGGGGIGLVLFSYIKSFHYNIASTVILLIALMVIIVDLITGKLRKEIIK